MDSLEKKQQLLEKFFDDRCTREELEELMVYLKHDQEPEYADVMQKAWDKLQHSPKMDPEAANRIFENVLQRTSKPVSEPAPARTIRLAPQWYRVAAVLTGLMVLGGLLYKISFTNQTIQWQTKYGQTMTVILPDQSVVKLNGNSTLHYQPDWDNTHPREVWLKGEGFFSVVHKQNNQPFLVHASRKASVEVLGTEFTVSDRDKATRVVLNSGSIRLKIQEPSQQKQLLMKPGDLVELKKGNQKVLQKRVDPQIYSAWTAKRLIFDNTPLREVVANLEDTYGLSVKVSDPDLLDRQVSGSTPINSIDVFLKGLSRSFNLQITRSGNTVEIRSNPEE